MKKSRDNLYIVWIVLFSLTILIGLITVWTDIAWVKKMLWGVLLLFSLAATGFMYPKSESKQKDNVTSIEELKKKKERKMGSK